MRSRSWKRIRFGALLAALVLAACGGGLWWLYYSDVKERAHRLTRARNIDKEFDTTVPDDVSRHLRIPVTDGATLDVWVIEPRAEPLPGSVHWAVVLHGIADQKRTMLGLGRRFANHGVGAILVDLRGHGLSSQSRISFGAREVPDLSLVLDEMERLGYELGEVGTYGPSYGGAIALLLGTRDPRVTRAVSAGGFSSFSRLIRPTLVSHNRTLSQLVPGFFVDHMVELAAGHGGFDPRDASADEFVKESDARFLLVHSREDEIVPYDQAQDFVARCPKRCELITLEDTTHHGSLSNKPLRFRMHWFLTGGPLKSL